MIRYGATPDTLLGLRLQTSVWVPDGQVFATSDAVFIGVAAETDAQHEGRAIVRAGLADVLRWLGQPTLTGRQVMLKLYAEASRER